MPKSRQEKLPPMSPEFEDLRDAVRAHLRTKFTTPNDAKIIDSFMRDIDGREEEITVEALSFMIKRTN